MDGIVASGGSRRIVWSFAHSTNENLKHNIMERVVNNKASEGLILNQKLQVFTELMSRANLASKLGAQYGTDRDLYEALGYKTTLTYEDFLVRYQRQDIAKAIIDRPVGATWQGAMRIIDDPGKEDTPLEAAWDTLNKELNLKNKFARLDRLSGIGQYGVLLLGLDDANGRDSFKREVRKNKKHKLLYIKPFGQDKAIIRDYITDTGNPRYGLPKTYEVRVQVAEAGVTEDIIVHHSRVIHVIGESLESEIFGIPRLEAVYNRLMDLEKIVGGDAEMFWRGARPGYQGKVDPDFQLTAEMEADLKDQIAEFEHNMRRILVNEGIDLQALAQQIAEPGDHVDVQIQMISAVTGIPKRILTGSERGELASSQDKSEYLSFVTGRREEYAEPNIVRPFADRCMEFGILPKPKDADYDIAWEDLFVLNEKERVEVGKARAMALREYSQNPLAETIIPPDTFVDIMLGLSPQEKAMVEQARSEMTEEEKTVTPTEESIISEEAVAVTVNNE